MEFDLILKFFYSCCFELSKSKKELYAAKIEEKITFSNHDIYSLTKELLLFLHNNRCSFTGKSMEGDKIYSVYRDFTELFANIFRRTHRGKHEVIRENSQINKILKLIFKEEWLLRNVSTQIDEGLEYREVLLRFTAAYLSEHKHRIMGLRETYHFLYFYIYTLFNYFLIHVSTTLKIKDIPNFCIKIPKYVE